MATRRRRGFSSLLALLLVAGIFLHAQSASGQTPAQTIKVVLDDNYPPYIFRNSAGELQGILVDQWELWSSRTGVVAQLTATDWGVAQQRMLAGEFDVIDTIFVNEKRKWLYDFSAPYARIDVPLFFQSELSGISKAEDVQGFVVAVKSGDNVIDVLRGKGVVNFIEFASYESIILAAKTGQVKVFTVDRPPALYYLNKYAIAEQFRETAPLYSGEFHRAVRKGNTEALALVTAGFAKITAAEYAAIDRRWLGAPLVKQPWIQPRYAKFAAAVVFIVVLLLTVGLMTLRRAVRYKTSELRKTNNLLNKIIENIPTMVFLKDARELRFVRFNRAGEELIGYSASELLGKTDYDFFPKEQAEFFTRKDREVLREKAVLDIPEEPLQTRDKGTRTMHTKKVPLLDANGEPEYLLGIAEDITERKQSEAAVILSEQQHRTILQTALDGFWMTDAQGQLLEVNASYCRMSGYSSPELLGMRITDLEAAEADVDTVARIRKTFTEGEDRFETRHRRKDGSVYDVEVSVQYQPFAGGRCVAFLRDITASKQFAAERSRLENQLRQSQKAEAIGRLAGGVAHDFNNLTAIILGYGEMLLDHVPRGDPSRPWAEQIVDAGRRSATLTRQLLAFSRKQTLQLQVLDLNALLRNLEKMLGRVIGENIELICKLVADPACVNADPGQLEQVVMNLAFNARDAMPLGGKLTCETAAVELDATLALGHESVAPGRYVLLTVSDTGCGMDQPTMERLFEPFFTTKPKGKGTGLGLATSYGIVKQSGGYITVASEPDKGTSVRIYLPQTEAAVPEKIVEAGELVSRGHGERILLVEDEAPLRELCETVLTRLGYQVSVAGTGAAALQLVQERDFQPDLLLTDVIMPGMSGAEMADRLRSGQPDLKVLYMSGYSDDAIAPHGVLDPGMHLIQKPFTEQALAKKVREVLDSPRPLSLPRTAARDTIA